ncbi:LysM peptidoglycan-binding domain-containing protein [Trinickia fusca]|uniref:LysM peptidoglycan-binding domain-containing protein n=1 Tax=Trinickia fusca TaxID=2419777 RepID=UPI0011C4196A|nr:LysM peptidoglycan-binding domain-containing protein [Trinickia fusca]
MTVHYFDAEGNETLYIGGSFAWRFNNPGNVTKPSRYMMPGAIGYGLRISTDKVPFIIFPDRETGHQAHVKVLKEQYGNSTIRNMISAYAPKKQNDTEGYIKFVTGRAGVSETDVVGSLSEDKFKAVSASMELKEGWKPGVIKVLGKPIQVDVRDKLNQPFAKQAFQVKGTDAHVDVVTDENGELPWLYSGLLGQDVHILYKRAHDELEHVGNWLSTSAATGYTFNAPYHLVPTRPWVHKTEETERPRIHVVLAGETLSSIAAKYGTTVDAMVAVNGLADPNHIYARQHLKIPAAHGGGAQHANAAASASAPAAKPSGGGSAASGASGGAAGANSAASVPAQGGAASAPQPSAPTPTHSAAGAGQLPGAGDQHSSQAVPPPGAGNAHGAARPPAAANAPAHGASHSAPPAAQAAQPAGSGHQRESGVTHQRNDNGHPETLVSSATLEPSGPAWCSRFEGSNSLDSLEPGYRAKATGFINALRAAGATVQINAAFRPVPRTYLMYWALMIKQGKAQPDKVPPFAGVPIDWVHRTQSGEVDMEASKRAAVAMCHGYKISQKAAKPGKSQHCQGKAVDLNITGYLGKMIKDPDGNDIHVRTWDELKAFGALYGVKYFDGETMHWSENGH